LCGERNKKRRVEQLADSIWRKMATHLLRRDVHCTLSRGKVQSLTFWSEGYDYSLIPIFRRGNDFYPINLIVKPDPKNPGKKMDTDLVLEKGLKWCDKGYKLQGP
jgi:hypothetical protein